MANTGFKGVDVRQTGTALVFRAFLQDSLGALLATGTTTVKLYELQSDGTIKSYDFSDNTFKTTALTTATLALTHRPGNNATTTTGFWTAALATLTGFTAGAIYEALVSNTGASPSEQMREFQYGSEQGDYVVGSIPAFVAGAAGGIQIAGANAASTYASLTITAALLVSGGATFTSSTGDGFACTSTATNGHGHTLTGNGTGSGLNAIGGATGHGVLATGGATSGSGLRAIAAAGNSNGVSFAGFGTGAGFGMTGGATGPGAKFTGGSTSGEGIAIATTAGDGVSILPTAGTGIVSTGNGTSKHGFAATGGTAGTSDGIKAVAGSGGADLRAPAIAGTLATLTTYTGNTLQTGDSFTRIGALGAGLTGLASAANLAIVAGYVDTEVTSLQTDVTTLIGRLTGPRAVLLDNLDAAISTRMATFALPAGFLTAAFPSEVASRTNITGGVMTTTTNLTNLPTAPTDWLTADALKADAAAEIAAATWDILTSGHTTTGTFGAAMQAAGSAGDPLATLVPGSYGAGTAGYRLGTFLDAKVSAAMLAASYADPTSALTTIAGAVATILGQTSTSGVALTAGAKAGISLAAAGLDAVVVETGINARQALSLIGAATAGKASGLDTTTATYFAIGASGTATARIVAIVDINGNRTGTTLTAPA